MSSPDAASTALFGPKELATLFGGLGITLSISLNGNFKENFNRDIIKANNKIAYYARELYSKLFSKYHFCSILKLKFWKI